MIIPNPQSCKCKWRRLKHCILIFNSLVKLGQEKDINQTNHTEGSLSNDNIQGELHVVELVVLSVSFDSIGMHFISSTSKCYIQMLGAIMFYV